MIDAEAEKFAIEQYRAYRGKEILLSMVSGYDEHDNSVDIHLNPPVRARVMETNLNNILHWNDEHLDPYWEVELLEECEKLKGISSLWVFGLGSGPDGTNTEEDMSWKSAKKTDIEALARTYGWSEVHPLNAFEYLNNYIRELHATVSLLVNAADKVVQTSLAVVNDVRKTWSHVIKTL